MAISKIIYKSSSSAQGETWMDLTQDTVAAANLISPNTAHGADGEPVVGAAVEKVLTTKSITANGTYAASSDNADGYSSVTVNVSGSSKNIQVTQGTSRTTSSTMTAIGAEMTVAKSGTYDVYWSAFRSNTSASYTYATQLYVGGSAYGSENSTWSNHVQNNHLSNVSLTANQKIRVYGRESRNQSYYIYAPTLVIVEA